MNRLLSAAAVQWLIIAAWLTAAVAAIPLALSVNHELESSTRLGTSESAVVDGLLQQKFQSPFSKIALLRIAGGPVARSAEGREVLRVVVAAIEATPGILGVISYLDRDDRLFIARDDSSIVITGLGWSGASGEALMERLGRVTDALRADQQVKYPDIRFYWTGEAAVNADMRRLSAQSTRSAELRVLPVTLLLTLLAFRGIVAALLPVLSGGLTVLVSLGAIACINRFFPTSIIVVGIVSMIGLGLSIDYALLIVSRYRDALGEGCGPLEAVAQASAHAGQTVLVSGSAVAIGFAGLLWVPVSEVRSIGIGGLVVTAVAVLIAITLLPVLLLRLGSWMDFGRVGRKRESDPQRHWRRWAAWVSRWPVVVLIVAGAPLVLLAAHAFELRTDLPRGRWLPDSADSVRHLHEMDAVATGSFGQMIDIILELPDGSPVQEEAGWRATSKVVRHYARDARIQHVFAVTALNASPLGGPELLAKLPSAARQSLVTADGRMTLIQLLPKKDLAATDAAAMVREIRASDPESLTGLAGTRLRVGGVPAFNIDYEDAIRHSLVRMVAIIVSCTLLVLACAFRSILIPVKAVALNLLSVAAAFGAVTLVFQDGHGYRLLGLPRPLDGGFPIVPVLVFAIVFGLSMDYEVFLVARVLDGRRAGLRDRDALIDGLARLGRVITLAAAIMIAVFGGFMFGDFVLIKILGFALSVAVFLDATLIRLAVGPALIQLAGRWNWWPGARA